MTLLISAILLALAWVLTIVLRRSANAASRNAEAAAVNELANTGLSLSGNVLGTFELRGPMRGVDVELTNLTTQKKPGASEESVTACVVRVELPLADQIVCKTSEIDLIMGPLPTAPRVRCDYANFDAAYAIFVIPTNEVSEGSYRSHAEMSAAPWAQPQLLDRLLELDLLWLRVRERRAEFVFPPLALVDVDRAARLVSAVALTSHGKVIPPLSGGARMAWIPWQDPKSNTSLVWWGGVFLGCIMGIFTALIPPLRWLDDELMCGKGDSMVIVHPHDGETSLACAGHPHNSLALYWLGSLLLAVSVVVLAGLILIASRRDRAPT
jgi:hypothetical protein